MTNQYSEIEKFFSTVSNFEQVVMSGEKEREKALINQKQLFSILNEKLQKLSLNKNNLSSLSESIEKVTDGILNTIKAIEKSAFEMEQRLQLQREYKERLIILVFGKVNSGKSSFSNYFVSLFPQSLPTSPYFYFENGKKQYSSKLFAVGCTETTTEIQGIELGKLVLLDTPGLHSVTEVNGELTKKYTDSADLILWLSGSNSPGQTQELEELKNEIEKGKVLFPIITKSDITEEDEEIQNGQSVIVKKLVMKSTETQRLQKDDVYARAQSKLKEFNVNKNLKKPVTLSINYAKEFYNEDNCIATSGISDLFYGLNSIYDEIIESKKNNVKLQVKNHKDITHKHLTDNIEKPFRDLSLTLENQKNEIKNMSSYISSMVLNSVNNQVTNIIYNHSQSKDIKAINNAIKFAIQNELKTQLILTFKSAFELLLEAVSMPKNLEINLESHFEDETISYTVHTGSRKKALTSGASGVTGSLLGAEIGTAILPIIGTFLGGVIGGICGTLAGSKAGEYFITHEEVNQVIGVNTSKVEAEIYTKLQNIIPKVVSTSIDNLLDQFKPLEDLIKQSMQEINQFKQNEDYL